jgi:hypothetical protein
VLAASRLGGPHRPPDHPRLVVDDLEAAKAFFVELGMELDGVSRSSA